MISAPPGFGFWPARLGPLMAFVMRPIPPPPDPDPPPGPPEDWQYPPPPASHTGTPEDWWNAATIGQSWDAEGFTYEKTGQWSFDKTEIEDPPGTGEE